MKKDISSGKCHVHNKRDAVAMCSYCGKLICYECKTHLKGWDYCPKCADPEKDYLENIDNPSSFNETWSNNKKVVGIVLTVVGFAIGFWTFSRVTSLVGQMHTFSPPFDQYEIITFFSGGIAILLVIIGLISLVSSQKTWDKAIDSSEDEIQPLKNHNSGFLKQSIADELKKFAELRDDGVITEEEFQAKKNELLNREQP